MGYSRTSIKLCTCGHGKSIHSGVFQRKRIEPAKCNFPECRCKEYSPVSGKSSASKERSQASS